MPFITLELNEEFCGLSFYCGYFDNENTFEIVLQIGRLELAIGLDFGYR